jgi:hypothetical protein
LVGWKEGRDGLEGVLGETEGKVELGWGLAMYRNDSLYILGAMTTLVVGVVFWRVLIRAELSGFCSQFDGGGDIESLLRQSHFAGGGSIEVPYTRS